MPPKTQIHQTAKNSPHAHTPSYDKKIKKTKDKSKYFKPHHFGSLAEGRGKAKLRKMAAVAAFKRLAKGEGLTEVEARLETPLRGNSKTSVPGEKIFKKELEYARKQKEIREAATLKRKQEAEERQQASLVSQARRRAQNRVMSAHTKKGQPVMKGRMSLLLEKLKARSEPKK